MKPFDYFIDKKNNLNTNILSNIVDLNSGIDIREIPVVVDKDNSKTLLDEKEFQELYDKDGGLFGFLVTPDGELKCGAVKFSDIKEKTESVTNGEATVQNSYVTDIEATSPFDNAIKFNIANNKISNPYLTFTSADGFYIHKVYGIFGKLPAAK